MVKRFQERGYWLARVDSVRVRPQSGGRVVDVEVWMTEGPRIYLGDVRMPGLTPSLIPAMEDAMALRQGAVFNPADIEQGLEKALNALENRGRPLAGIRLERIALDTTGKRGRLDLILDVDAGPLVYVDSLGVEGNTLTRTRIILREIRMKSGELYSQNRVNAAVDRIRKLGFFREVGQPRVTFRNGRARIIFPVKEGNANTLDGVLGYQPPAREGERGVVTGRLEFVFRNLLGTGRFLEAYWEKKDRDSQAMRFGYEEPWILGLPVHLGGRFRQEIRDTTYVERGWNLSARFTPWMGFSLYAEAGIEEVLPDSTGSALYDLPRSRAELFTLGLDYNTLDDPVNPRRGIRYNTVFTTGRKRNLGPEFLLEGGTWKRRVSTRRVEIHAEAVLPAFSRQVVYIGAHGIEVRTGDAFVPLADQIRFGGARTLRGYQEDAFRGSLAGWVNGEYRYILSKRSRAFLFVDTGFYQRREKDGTRVRENHWGFGLGVRLETRLGIVGVDYGLGEGDTFLQGKIHVGLVNRF
jgi:outer membrane protein insertion porin family